MLATTRRYLRAFWLALKMTARGQRAEPPTKPPILAWIEQSAVLVNAIYSEADRAGLDKNARQALILKLDGRDTSMDTLLAVVDHHARTEYPFLLKNMTQHSLLAIRATNMDDQYRVQSLHESPALAQYAEVQQVVAQLSAHLNAIPSDNPSGG